VYTYINYNGKKMKRFIIRYFYILALIPLMITIQGCNNLASLGSGEDDDINSESLIVDNEESALDKLKKEKEEADKKAVFDGTEEIILSSNSASFDIDSEGRSTPFVPYKERNLKYNIMDYGDLPLPPASGVVDENVATLISAKVTGILYEANSPSAIINVLDSDYLVKPGDKIESFQISSITPEYVAIKTGSNIYRAKVGDIVDGELYGTGVYNLGHRFAGTRHPARKEDILYVQMKGKKSGTSNEPASLKDYSLPPIPDLGGILPKINITKTTDDVPLPPAVSVPTPPTTTKQDAK